MTDTNKKEIILHKEIDLVQNIISRMASNSFLLKAWLVSLVAILLALNKETIVATNLNIFSVIIIIPVLIFWYLDAFFLHKEKCYIKLYEWIINNRETSDQYKYDLNYKRFINEEKSIFRIMLSETLVLFYGLIVICLIFLTLYNWFIIK
ncbi:hypothetical protein [Wenyingzhuangia sp. IMCC45574]